MKRYIFLLVMLLPLMTYSQYDGAAIGGTVFSTQLAEGKPLGNIADVQKEIALMQTAIATEYVELSRIELALYKGMTKADGMIADLKIILKIIESSDNIIKFVTGAKDIVVDKPYLQLYVSQKELDFLETSAFLITDIVLAVTEKDTNVMNNADRFKILNVIQTNMNLIEKDAARMFMLVRRFSNVESLDPENLYRDIVHDFTSVFDDMNLRYLEIFPENIRD